MAPAKQGQASQSCTVWPSLIAGGVSGASARTCTAPLARLTILLQLSSGASRVEVGGGVSATLQRILRVEGFWALWRGNMASVLQKFPATAINYYVYELVKVQSRPLWSSAKDPGSHVRFTAGFAAGVLSVTTTYPLDLARTQLAANTQVGSVGYHSGLSGSIMSCYRDGVLYRGWAPTMLCQSVNLSLCFGFYESLQSKFFLSEGKQRSGILPTIACGGLAGVCSSCLVHPLDLLRRRQQMGSGQPAWQVAGDIVRSQGVAGLYRGLAPELFKVVPSIAINFYVYEFMRQEVLKANIAPR